MYALAAKYGIDGLKALALHKIKQTLEDNWRGEFFVELAKEAYTKVDEDSVLRSTIVKIAATHVHELARVARFISLLREGGDFICDFIDKLHQEPSKS